MRYSMIAAPLALAAGANAWGNGTVYTTEVVTAFTTFCPYATTFSHGSVTYTVTEATTLTITNCPCTITKPVLATSAAVSFTPSAAPVVSTPVVSSVPVVSSAAPVISATAPVTTAVAPTVIPPFPISSSVAPAPPAPTATSAPSASVVPVSPVSPSPSSFTGAGSRVAASGAGLAAVLGLAAFLL